MTNYKNKESIIKNRKFDINLFIKWYSSLLISKIFTIVLIFGFLICLFLDFKSELSGILKFILTLFYLLFLIIFFNLKFMLYRDIKILNGKYVINLNSGYKEFKLSIAVKNNGEIILPYQFLNGELNNYDKNFKLSKNLLFSYDYDPLFEKDVYYEFINSVWLKTDQCYLLNLSQSCGQNPKMFLNNIKRLQLSNKEMVQLVKKLYKIKELNYKNYIKNNLDVNNNIIYQESNIYQQIEQELLKVRQNLKQEED